MPHAERDRSVGDYDCDKVDEMVLALLSLTIEGDGRAWKSHDWNALDRLHEHGYISDPKTKAKSVLLTEEGERRARELFARHFSADVEQRGNPSSCRLAKSAEGDCEFTENTDFAGVEASR